MIGNDLITSPSSGFSIRLATAGDAQIIWELEKEGWISSYTNDEIGMTEELIKEHFEGKHGELIEEKVQAWKERILSADADRIVFVALQDDQVVGFIAPSARDGFHRLGSVYVSAQVRNNGIGTKLLEKSFAWHGRHDIYIYVVAYHHKAIAFYERYGFVELERGYVTDKLPRKLFVPNIKMVKRTE